MIHRLAFLIFFSFTFVTYCNGVIYFNDEFDRIDYSKWKVEANEGSVLVENGVLSLQSTNISFPVLYSKFNNIFNNEKATILEIKFKYDSEGSMGTGLSVGYTGGLVNDPRYPFYQFSLWRDYEYYFVHMNYDRSLYNFCKPYIDHYESQAMREVEKNLSFDNNWHTLTIERRPGFTYYSFVAYLDKYSNPRLLGIYTWDNCNPENIILGNPLTGGQTHWTNISFDYVRVYSSDNTDPFPTTTPPPPPTDTPTPPEPTPEPKRKIIFLPGMGGSWNTKELVLGNVDTGTSWGMTPFVHIYDNLEKALEFNGLKKNTDFYIWNYDWRKHLPDIVQKFDIYVKNHVGPDEKVDILGHSLGGLVARVWAQQNINNPKLGKVITFGSPHQGAIDAYTIWNGNRVVGKDSITSTALKILIAFQKKNSRTKNQVIHGYAPILKDIQPLFNFAMMEGEEIDFAGMKNFNSQLNSINQTISTIYPNLYTFTGNGVQSKRWLNLVPATAAEVKLGIWPDGRPETVIEDVKGDGTVLQISAGTGQAIFNLSSDHGQIVDKGLNEALKILNLNEYQAAVVPEKQEGKKFYLIGSPADLQAKCGDELIYSNDEGWIITDKVNCNLTIVGKNNGGEYHLVRGVIGGEEDFDYFENDILSGETQVFSETGNNTDYYKSLVKRDLGLLNGNKWAGRSYEYFMKGDYLNALDLIIRYCWDSGEFGVSDRIINNLIRILSKEAPAVNKILVNRLAKLTELEMDRIDQLSKKSGKGWLGTDAAAANFIEAQELLDKANGNGNQTAAWYQLLTARGLLYYY